MSPSTSEPTDSPTTLECKRSSVYEMRTDSTSFRWKANNRKSCDWIARNATKDSVALNCPQACRKCCADGINFRIITPIETENTCQWLTRDPNPLSWEDRYCNSVQMGTLISAKCPLSCQMCVNSDPPTHLFLEGGS
jgi:hypothetical protein